MSKFEHSIPVPRLYKTAAKIAKKVKENGANLKSLVYAERHLVQPLYALVAETFQHFLKIDFILKRTQLLEKEPRFDPWLARILITELLWGKRKLPGESKPVKTLLAYQQSLNAHLADINEEEIKEKRLTKPRYVRINVLKITVNKAISLFQEEGWRLIECDKNNYEGFLQKVANLSPDEFLLDLHIEDLLIFPPGTTFHNHEAYFKGLIVLQDKASCLPIQALNPPPNSTVLDMCAAPGMKTSHIAAKMNNKGLIYAVDIDANRFEELEKLMDKLGVTCVKIINKDVLSLSEKNCPGIEYILVDPSCSGSGIVDRLDFDFEQAKTSEERLKKLAGFQILMLKHAFKRFPNAKRVVYSTCSVNPEENEAVVQEVLSNCDTFRLVEASDELKLRWLNFGSPKFNGVGTNCLYAKPEIDHTNGFFIAIFERAADNKEQKRNKRKLEEAETETLPKAKKREIRLSEENMSGQEFETVKDMVFGRGNSRKNSEDVSLIEEKENNKINKLKLKKEKTENTEGNDIKIPNGKLNKKKNKKNKYIETFEKNNQESQALDKVENSATRKKKHKHQEKLKDTEVQNNDDNIIDEEKNCQISQIIRKRKKSKYDKEKAEEENNQPKTVDVMEVTVAKENKHKFKSSKEETPIRKHKAKKRKLKQMEAEDDANTKTKCFQSAKENQKFEIMEETLTFYVKSKRQKFSKSFNSDTADDNLFRKHDETKVKIKRSKEQEGNNINLEVMEEMLTFYLKNRRQKFSESFNSDAEDESLVRKTKEKKLKIKRSAEEDNNNEDFNANKKNGKIKHLEFSVDEVEKPRKSKRKNKT